MRMEDIAIDVTKMEEGDWVENIPLPGMAGLRLKTRGSENRQWKKLFARLTTGMSRNKLEDPIEREKITAQLVLETALLDWDGIFDVEGKPVRYSKEQAKEYFTNPRFADFVLAAQYAANTVARQRQSEIEEDAKN